MSALLPSLSDDETKPSEAALNELKVVDEEIITLLSADFDSETMMTLFPSSKRSGKHKEKRNLN